MQVGTVQDVNAACTSFGPQQFSGNADALALNMGQICTMPASTKSTEQFRKESAKPEWLAHSCVDMIIGQIYDPALRESPK